MKVAFERNGALAKAGFADAMRKFPEKLDFAGIEMDIRKIKAEIAKLKASGLSCGSMVLRSRDAAVAGLAGVWFAADDPENELMFAARWFIAGCGASWAFFWAR